MEKYILSLDQGTTSSRAILFDKEGHMVSCAQKEFRQLYPKPGWVEHDPHEIWSTQLQVAKESIKEAGLTHEQVAALGITNQRETTVVWDRATGEPVYNAIVWQDRRTSDYCDRLKDEGWGEKIRGKTGLVIDAYFSATKIKWILEHVAGAREKAREGKLAFGTIDSWLIWNLTEGKVHITDVTNASRTMLYNIHTLEWDEELLQLFEIPAAILPEVRSSSEVFGETEAHLLDAEIPIAGIAGDQQAALFGQMCTKTGMVKNTYGTGCFMLMNVGDKPVLSTKNLVTTIAWKFNGQVQYALEGSIFIGGAVVQWLRDGLGLIASSGEIEGLASQVKDSDGVYIVPAFTGLGAPHWDQHARGTIVGMTRGTTAAHLARAALESIAFQTMDILKAMAADSGVAIKELRVDGGATANDLLMQFQADILGAEVIRPQITEVTALGAAYLAGLAIGYWDSPETIQQQWKIDRSFQPGWRPGWRPGWKPDLRQEENGKKNEMIKGWNRAIKAARAWAAAENEAGPTPNGNKQ